MAEGASPSGSDWATMDGLCVEIVIGDWYVWQRPCTTPPDLVWDGYRRMQTGAVAFNSVMEEPGFVAFARDRLCSKHARLASSQRWCSHCSMRCMPCAGDSVQRQSV